MRSRLMSLIPLRSQSFYITIEATLIGVFFVQALRYLIGSLYARIGSASQYNALDPSLINPDLPGLITPSTISNEISLLVYLLALPLLVLIIGRFRWLLVLGAVITAIGRYLMIADTSLSPTVAASITVGGGLFYIALLIRHRMRFFPIMILLALSIDQIIRAFGDTLDPTWDNSLLDDQTIFWITLSVFLAIVLTFINIIRQQTVKQSNNTDIDPDRGLLTFWGGLGLGGLFFIELALLTLPNAIIGRAGYTSYAAYPIVTPMLIIATALPLLPHVRVQARRFISLFDSGVRGWSWMLIIALLVVLGTRVEGVVALVSLVVAQFFVSMAWWWLTRPQAQKERNLTGLWVVLSTLIFGVLLIFDIFTYEYAFVRDFAPELDFLNPIIPPILRGFRGLGFAVILFAVFLALLPMVQTRKRIPWASGKFNEVLYAVIGITTMALIGAYASRPIVVQGVTNPTEIRVGTYNIHAGFNEFFNYDLEEIALAIDVSGANVVLLQEIETGRLTSFGVDQVLWLARRTGMDARFYAVNEGLQGLAVLSDIEIVFDDGNPLSSISTQTGLQRVQIRPDQNIITIYNTWLSPLLQTSDAEGVIQEYEDDQQRQVEEIFNLIVRQIPAERLRSSRTILGGTFNNVPDSDLITDIRELGGAGTPLFVDPFAGINLQTSATYIRTGQTARLDYLWVTNGLPVLGAITVNSSASDHRLATILVRLQ